LNGVDVFFILAMTVPLTRVQENGLHDVEDANVFLCLEPISTWHAAFLRRLEQGDDGFSSLSSFRVPSLGLGCVMRSLLTLFL
jgi:hypothetical protein